MKPVF